MTNVGYGDLKRARSVVLRDAKKQGLLGGGRMSMDTTRPMVRYGLEIVEFDVSDACHFAREITERNLFRISIAKGKYSVDLFTAALCSGMTYGAMAERRRV